jgi:integrase/recombinase XerD
MATVKAVLKKEGRKDKTHLVLIRLTGAGSAYLSTGVYVRENHFNPKGSLDKCDWIVKDPLRETYNAVIEEEIKKAKALNARHGNPTATQLKRLLTEKEESRDFLSFFKTELERREKLYQVGKASYSTFRKHTSTYNKLKEYAPSIPFDRLTPAFLEKFRHHCLTAGGNDPDTATKHLAVIRANVRQAMLFNLMPRERDPFFHVPVKYLKKQKTHLTLEELKRIRDAQLPKGRVSHARDLFMLQFYCHGARVGSMLQLRRENIQGDRIRYKDDKTDKHYSILIGPEIQRILDRYEGEFVLPFLTEVYRDEKKKRVEVEKATSVANKALKKVCTFAKVDKKVTTHTARHTFTSLAVKGDVSPAAVQAMLGHSSLRQTQAYMDEFREGELDRHAASVYGGFSGVELTNNKPEK